MSTLRGLLFDLDGTIAETERFGHRVAYNRAFAEIGLDWEWSEQLYGTLLAIAGGKERIQYYVEHYHPEMLAEAARGDFIGSLHRTKARHFEALASSIDFRPGFAHLVDEARIAGVKIAIATTASRPGVEALLARDPAVAAAIDVIAAGEDAERKKPAPDIYLYALQKLGLDAASCIAIEDSNIGLRAALAAQLTTLVTVSDYTKDQDFTGAAAVLPSLHGVDLAYLEQLLPVLS